MTESRRMEGKRVLVTGGGRGIGRGVALEFAIEGADVAVHYSSSAEGAIAVAEEIRGLGRKSEAFRADFHEADRVSDMAKDAIDFLGGIDIVINNAGFTTSASIDKIKSEVWDRLFEVNVRGMYIVAQAAVESMRTQGNGSIVNISSTHAFNALVDHSLYAATKGAIVAFTRTLSVELAPMGIRVNAIAPGLIVVDHIFDNIPDFDPQAIAKESIPAQIPGQPWDVARLAIFLSSDDARYIVGQTIVIDGGQSCSISEGLRRSGDFVWGKSYTPWL